MSTTKTKTLPVTFEDVKKAQNLISNDVVYTKLVYADHMSQMKDAFVYIKPENMQRVKSFKIRGALNKIKSLSDEQKAKGVIAPSAGNHAQGVALAATMVGVKSYIVMPETAPLLKVNATRAYGGEVILAKGSTFDDASALAIKLQKEHGYTLIHAFDDREVIAGQGTIGLEILQDLPEVDIVVTPVGGGGLLAGLCVAMKTINPRIKIYGVEPEDFNCMQKAIKDKKIETLSPTTQTIADGCAVKRAGINTYAIAKKLCDGIVTVTEAEVHDALNHLIEKCKYVAEGAGALATAAILNDKIPNIKGKRVVSLITGGNVDIDKLLMAIGFSLTKQGRRTLMSFKHSDAVVNKLCDCLAKHKAKAYTMDGTEITKSFKPKRKDVLIGVFTIDNSFKKELFDEIDKLKIEHIMY